MNAQKAAVPIISAIYKLQSIESEFLDALEKIETLNEENKRLKLKLLAAEQQAAEQQLAHLLENTNEHN